MPDQRGQLAFAQRGWEPRVRLMQCAVAGYHRCIAFVRFVPGQFCIAEGMDTRRVHQTDVVVVVCQISGQFRTVAPGGFHADMTVAKAAQPGCELAASRRGIGKLFGFILLIVQQYGDIKFVFGDINADRGSTHYGTP
ncbi:hypothetical protein D3C76_994170 [compost metagenome]